MLGASISKNGILLTLFALITATVLASTFLMTREQISESERRAQQRALFEIIPEQRHDNDLLEDVIPVPLDAWAQLGLRDAHHIHLARQGGEVIGAIIPSVAPDGYSGDIRMIVGVNKDLSIAGVRVLNHRETPGLGDKVDLSRSDWILDFDGTSLTEPAPSRWEVRKDGGDFDQFTGATITPRAVVRQVRRTLAFATTHQALLFPDTQISETEETEQ
ncbi:electron transport complex subunit RsxG [Marinimicrobium alkaliphilum]|uniref:electron transport complex subunit RsxG n=1 Tax=Marinimicrobium alkaliphilum TaxID=2202654 RepID=UPI000DB9332C|nr:electron transport complex subunit RsxG [Marinimicrobium alkaliphilum]